MENAPTQEKPYGFDWIEDDNLLRDEGVLFGLSESDTKHKVEAITKYYALKVEGVIAFIENLDDRIGALKEKAELLEGKIVNSLAQIDQLHMPVERKHIYLLAIALRFLFFLAAIILNFWLIHTYLAKATSSSFVITTGLYILGTLTLFNAKSHLFLSDKAYEKEDREMWKALLEEYGVPAIVTLFIILLGWTAHPVHLNLGYALIFLTLFLFTGKGFTSMLPLLIEEHAYFRKIKKLKKAEKRKLEQLENELAQDEAELKTLKEGMERREEEKYQKINEINGLERERDTKIALFLSEYELTVAAKEKIMIEKLNEH
jgi:ABC-type multidrug transport system fused ATPase/permease subunit